MGNSFLNRKFRYNFCNATVYIIIANVLVFLAIQLFPGLVYRLSMVPVLVFSGYFWTPFTYMFTHASFSHLLFNMLSLYIFGTALERRIGSKEFVLFYLITGTLSGISSLLIYWLTGNYFVALLGASGALYAVLFMFAVFYPFSTILVFGIIPVRAPLLILIYFCIELFSQIFSIRGGVAHLTHLSGLLFAYLYCRIRMRIKPLDVFRRTM